MIKNESEIKLMRESGRLLSLVFDYINKLNLLGKSTFEINNIVEKYIIEETMCDLRVRGNMDLNMC